MKKWIALTLALAMVFSLTGCGCKHQWQEATCTAPKTCSLCGETEGEVADHVPGELTVVSVDTQKLTMTHELPCSLCGAVIETKESATGIAPVGSVIHVSPNEWYDCLMTTVRNYGASQSLFAYPVEAQDDTLLHSLVSMSQMNAVFSFHDAQAAAITTGDGQTRGCIHNIRMDAQFTNDNAQEFFMLLMLVLLNNNASLDPADANTLAGQIMAGTQISDNGYVYAMEIISAQDHTVCVSITAQ